MAAFTCRALKNGFGPAKAEKWLSMAAGRGDKEAKKLLAQVRSAKVGERRY